MSPEEQRRILREALELYGADSCVDLLIEEMAELTQAIMKSRRYQNRYRSHHVIEELADVMICIESLKIILSGGLMKEGGINALLSEYDNIKMCRLKKRILADNPNAFRKAKQE
jgi:NTP pyrophosphatase (non-canonical NTP hydrolase)